VSGLRHDPLDKFAGMVGNLPAGLGRLISEVLDRGLAAIEHGLSLLRDPLHGIIRRLVRLLGGVFDDLARL
jgi:hypothetical protein